MKKPLLYLNLVMGALLLSSSCSAIECEAELDPEIEALLDPNFLELEVPVPVQKGCFSTANILALLAPPNATINLVNILKEDIYKKTTGPVTRRSLLDEPALIPDYFSNNCWTFTTDLFYNFSPRVFFTENSPFIIDYIALNNANILNEISAIEFPNLNIPRILGLFSNLKLQQHRAGFMFGFARQMKHWHISFRIPLYYLLEHFFLTEQEQEQIENDPFFQNLDGSEFSSEDEVRKFGLRHLASDRFGFGDARFSVLANIYEGQCAHMWLGLQTTLPTAKSIVRGLIAAEFDPKRSIPPFNLQHFFDVFFCSPNEAVGNMVLVTEGTNFALSVLDRLSTILINAPLGNGKHFGFGPEFDFRYIFNDYFSAHTYASLQVYTPHHENRFFLIKKNPADFDRNWQDPTMLGESLALLNRLIVQTLFPIGVVTTIYPGLRFQCNQAFMYKSSHWDMKLGFDYWYQAREKLSALLPIIPCDLPLDTTKAMRSAAQQGKLFATVGYYDRLCNGVDWHISLNMDGTLFHKGIGENYTLSLRGGLEF